MRSRVALQRQSRVTVTANSSLFSRIARRFGSQLGSPVHNDTGLTGKYDLELKWGTRPPNPDDNAPDFITAVQGQLGLKLEKKKAPVDMVVVDHAEKTPSGN